MTNVAAMSIINNFEVENLVKGKAFDEVSKECSELGISVRTRDGNADDRALSELYLLVSKEDGPEALKLQCNGIILEKNTNKVVCACQNKFVSVTTDEMKSKLAENGKDVVLHNDPRFRVEYCEDGTVMRLYNYQNTWYTATTKCIDARGSYWSSDKTFDDMFWETFDKGYLYQLDKDFTYVFILLHSENRIVVKHNKNNLVYISRINNTTMEEDYRNILPFAWRPRVVPYFNLDDFNSYYWPQKRGILVKVRNGSHWTMYKIDFDRYAHIKEVRGNVPNIKMRYLELLGDEPKQRDLEKYYSEHRRLFEDIRKEVFKLVKTIHQLYVDSHIKRTTQVTEEHIFYRTLRQLHAQYKTTNKPICYEDVQAKLKSLDKNVVKKFLGWE